MANQMTLYGTVATTTSATTVDECAYQTLEAGNQAFGYDGSSQCEQFSALTGYASVADPGFTYYVQGEFLVVWKRLGICLQFIVAKK
jgi:hypothetical protein